MRNLRLHARAAISNEQSADGDCSSAAHPVVYKRRNKRRSTATVGRQKNCDERRRSGRKIGDRRLGVRDNRRAACRRFARKRDQSVLRGVDD